MVEKFSGIIPLGSIWYRFSREEAITFLQHTGHYERMTPQHRKELNSIDLQALLGKTEDIEQQISEVGLNIVTLHD